MHDGSGTLNTLFPGIQLAWVGTIYNGAELAKKIGLSADELRPTALLLAHCYEKWGVTCAEHLIGDFAFAIWDERKQVLYCVRDHHGVEPFFYTFNGTECAFANHIDALLPLEFVSEELNEEWIADYLCRIWLSRSSTLYKAIVRLEPGHWLQVTPQGLQTNRYWRPKPALLDQNASDDEYIDGFKEKLYRAVRRRTPSTEGVAAELSGGLDSSTVVAIAQHYQNDLATYSYVLPEGTVLEHLRDERKEVTFFAEQKGLRETHFITDEGLGLQHAFEWNLRIPGEPPKEMNSIYRETMYAALQNSQRKVLLSGFGGDEAASHHASGYLDELARTGRLSTLLRELRASEKSTFKKLGGIALKALFGFNPQVYDRWMPTLVGESNNDLYQKLLHRPIRQELFDRVHMKERFEAYQALYYRTGNFMNDQIRRLEQPHIMYRLEACNFAARSFNVAYRYPLLDVELIEYYLGLPLHMKARHGQGRYIFRQAVKDVLPEQLLWRKSKKGSSNPHLVERARIDGALLQQRLLQLSEDHPIQQYADFSKTKELSHIPGGKNKRKWHHTTTDFMNLLLAEKLAKSSTQSMALFPDHFDAKTFWKAMVKHTDSFTKPAYHAQLLAPEQPWEQVFLQFFRELPQHPTLQKASKIRVYLGSGEDYADMECLLASPPLPKEGLETWGHRIFEGQEWCIVLDKCSGIIDALALSVASFTQPVVQAFTPGCFSNDISLYIGRYQYTPFGAHLDIDGVSVVHLHLGPGQKEMTIWEKSYFQQLTGSDATHWPDFEGLLPKGKTYTLQTGDVFHLPASTYYHVGRNCEFSMAITIGLKKIGPHDLLRKSLAEMKKNPDEITAQTAIEEFKLRSQSNNGFMRKPQPTSYTSKEVAEQRFCLQKPFKLITHTKSGGKEVLYARGHRIDLMANNMVLIQALNNGQTILAPKVEAPDSEDTLRLLTDLYNYKAIKKRQTYIFDT